MKRTRRRILFWIVAGLLIALFAGSILLLRSIALPQRHKAVIEAQLRGAMGRDVWIGRASLRFLGGIGIEFEDLVVKDWDGKSDFIRVKGLILQMKLLPLLKRQLRWKSLILERPTVYLRRSRDGSFNFWGKRRGSKHAGEKDYGHVASLISSLSGGEIRIRQGTVHFLADFPASGPNVVGIENLSIGLKPISMEAPIPFHLHARQPNPTGSDGRIRVDGKLHPLSEPLEWSKIPITAEVRAKNVNPLPLWPYYGPYIPMEAIRGYLDIHAHYEGSFSGLFRSRGQIRVKGVEFDYRQVFETVLKPREFVVDYDVRMNRRSLIVSNVFFKLPEIEIRGSCSITEIGSPRRRIEAFATTGSFQFDGIGKYIPYGILSPGLRKLLREVTRGGKGKIVSLRIEGPIEDYSTLEDPERADLIYGKMRMEGVAYSFAKAFHPVENISGWVILEEGSLRFQDLKGSYRRSRLNATEMIISRIYSSPRLNLGLEGAIDVEGIADIAKSGAFPGRGIPIRDISGKGDLQLRVAGELSDSSGLSYNGHLVLKGADVSIKGLRLSVAATSGKVVFSNDRVRLIGVRGKMGNSPIWIDGQVGNPWLGKPGRERLELSLRGELDLGECFSRILPSISPRISQALAPLSDIAGEATIALELAGSGNGFEAMSYRGRASLGKAVFRLHRMVSPVRLVKGYIDFTPKMIRFSNMEARLRGSYLSIEGSVRDYLRWERSKIDLGIRAPNLDIGDFRLKKGGERGWIWASKIPFPESGRLALRVDEGRWRYTVFSNLTAQITMAEGRLDLERFNFNVKGGEVDLTAWVDLGNEGGVAFALNPKLSHVDAGRFFRDLGLEERIWITGAFNLWGNLMGRGHNEKELRRSLEGKLRVGMEKGRIRRFRLLSKVFSLFNVLQLFKGKLPGLTGEGLPYNTITGEIGIAKGIARTNNLLVDSDAMKITIIGEADIVREALDLTVGLRPLGTVDTIVSNVPVVGRILAGEDESI
ncbi:MAG: AsmA-like C-terminal domain-containing protein, partial [Deltaproteobacteria bacterium]|nr:AsmA-like C-terminal domain-containing protein [Deltaproteobacteria bacterium]